MTPCIWITGLSAAGKSTLARALHQHLKEMGVNSYVLDGDELRQGLCSDLTLTDNDREENIRRMAQVAKIMTNAKVVAICAIISPFEKNRQLARALFATDSFVEVYLSTPIQICSERDPKGLYAKAKRGEINGLTGWDAPYEVPTAPEFTFNTAEESLSNMVSKIVDAAIRD